MSLTYKDSGVDIDAGNKLVDLIKPLAKATARTGSNPDLGGFGGLFDLKACNFKDPVLVSATDGVGTKLKIAIDHNIHDTIGIDLVAMSVNDLVVQGAQPLFFLDYFACSKLDTNIAKEVISGVSEGCKQANCALIGGETAEMPGMYQEGDYDLAGFAVGAVERDQILPREVKSGDVLIGLKSSGLHSNGFSLARHVIATKNISYQDKAFSDKTLAEELLTPTKVYVKPCLEAIATGKVKALSHITGGGLFENLQRVINKDLAIDLDFNSWQMPEIFNFLQQAGDIKDEEMYRTFNCGIGMILITDENDTSSITSSLNEEAIIIGKLK